MTEHEGLYTYSAVIPFSSKRSDLWPQLDRCRYRRKETEEWANGRLISVIPGNGSSLMSAIIEDEDGQLVRLDVKRSKFVEDCSGYIGMMAPDQGEST